jgi:hypothetical protein
VAVTMAVELTVLLIKRGITAPFFYGIQAAK